MKSLPREIFNSIQDTYDEIVADEWGRLQGALDLQARMHLIKKVDERMHKAANSAVDRLTLGLRKSLHMDNIGVLIKERRDALGKTQKDIQKETGLPRSVLSRYENGRRVPSKLRSIRRLCKSLWPPD